MAGLGARLPGDSWIIRKDGCLLGSILGRDGIFRQLPSWNGFGNRPAFRNSCGMGSMGSGGSGVRRLERLRLGTPYPDVVRRVKEIAGLPLIAMGRSVVVDGTGVGAPVVDLLRRAGMGCSVLPVLITGGGEGRTSLAGGYESVPRSVLLTGLQVLIQQGRVRVASDCREAETLWRELLGLKLVGPGSREEHDDLAVAVALAVWKARAGLVVSEERR